MTAATTARLYEMGPNAPHRVTTPLAANTLARRGTFVSENASGYGVVPTDGDGLNVIGVAMDNYDNRTGSEAGGTAGDLDAELHVGITDAIVTGTLPTKRGQRLYVVDNQTVSIDDNGGTRGLAGFYVAPKPESTTSVMLLVGPMAVAASGAGSLGVVDFPITSLRLATGAAVAAFSAGSADGFTLADSEAFGVRFNDDVFTSMAGSIALPNDLDADKDITLRFIGFRVGSADTTAVLTVGVFFQTLGAAHTADANAGGSTTAFDGATTIVTMETLTIAAADVPASPGVLTFTMVPSAALDDDDLVIVGIQLLYTKR